MAKNLVFERTTTTKMQVTGVLDLARNLIIVDGEERKLSTLFADFNGGEVTVTVQIKDKEEFDVPEEEQEA